MTAAGFQEVSGLGAEIDVVEWRSGNSPPNAVKKLPGLFKVNDVSLRRGLFGVTDLWNWFRQARDGDLGAFHDVTISLMDENHENVVMTWKLSNAFPRRWSASPLNAQASEVAIEELVLASEGLDLK